MAKEGFFGGLPDDLFDGIVNFLQGEAGKAGSSSGPALGALVSLAQSEHAAATSTYEVRQLDAVFRALDLQKDLEALPGTPAGSLPAALAAFKGKLDGLTKFWKGQ